MKSKAFSTLRCVFAALVLSLPASAGWARGDAVAAVSAREAAAPAPAESLADQIDALLADRFDAASGLPASEARRQALEDLNQFAQLTVEGLIEASPSSELRSLMDGRLRPILSRHQHNIAEALAALGERPAASADFLPAAANVSNLAAAP